MIYLDEAQTRGTDPKLPRGYRAGVTLGPALTKDKLTQGICEVSICERFKWKLTIRKVVCE
jgi:hypothetical protein